MSPRTISLLIALLVAGASVVAQEHIPQNAPTAVLRPAREATLSADVAATVVEIPKRLGERVDAGETLVRLDATLFVAARDRAAAVLAEAQAHLQQIQTLQGQRVDEKQAEADLAAAKTALAAAKTLRESRQSSLLDLAAAEASAVGAEAALARVRARAAPDLATARRQLAEAEADLILAEQRLRSCTIAAPFAGRVQQLHVHPHERVDPGMRLVTLVEDARLHAVYLAPPEQAIASRIGDRVRIVFGGDTIVEGVIAAIAPDCDPASRTTEIRAAVDNRSGALRIGMTGRLVSSSADKGAAHAAP